jgi:enamine deaminase RidA (YjgF/YER057c/UK114 family)
MQKDKKIIERFHVGSALSDMAIYHGTVYLAGQVTTDETLDIVGQTTNVLSQIDALLAQAGSDKSRILMCQIFLSDFANFAAMNEVWINWVTPGHTPPRATVQTPLLHPEWLIEIVITAAIS